MSIKAWDPISSIVAKRKSYFCESAVGSHGDLYTMLWGPPGWASANFSWCPMGVLGINPSAIPLQGLHLYS